MFHTKWFEQFHCNSNVKLNERMEKKEMHLRERKKLTLLYSTLQTA